MMSARTYTSGDFHFAVVDGSQYIRLEDVIDFLPEYVPELVRTRKPREPWELSKKRLILDRIAAGMSNGEIAEAVGCSVEMVRNYKALFYEQNVTMGRVNPMILGKVALEVFYEDARRGMTADELAQEYGINTRIVNDLLEKERHQQGPEHVLQEIENDTKLQQLDWKRS